MEAMEVTVFRLSWGAGAAFGWDTTSLLADVLRESHEKLIPSFFGGGVGVGLFTVDFDAGGGPHGIDGKFPERP